MEGTVRKNEGDRNCPGLWKSQRQGISVQEGGPEGRIRAAPQGVLQSCAPHLSRGGVLPGHPAERRGRGLAQGACAAMCVGAGPAPHSSRDRLLAPIKARASAMTAIDAPGCRGWARDRSVCHRRRSQSQTSNQSRSVHRIRNSCRARGWVRWVWGERASENTLACARGGGGQGEP